MKMQAYSVTNIKRFRICLIVATMLKCNALNSFLHYKNGECSGESNIKGTLIYEYDYPKNLPNNGFMIESYNGPCYYLEGGFHNLENNDNAQTSISKGYCMKCNGVLGCSGSKYDCNQFYTLAPKDADNQDTINYNTSVINEAIRVQRTIYRHVLLSNKLPISELLGGAVAIIFLLSLLTGSVTMIQKIREDKKEKNTPDQSLYNNEDDDYRIVKVADNEVKTLVPSFIV
jgi:hypothetical protein